MDAEKDILKIKAHEKLLGAASRAPLRKENSSANQDGSPNELLSKTKHNRRQRQLYNKWWKAKKAQEKQKAQNQPKANTTAATAPPPVVKPDP